ncbi:GHMP family kinase ATP-binding protein [Paramaledivibacter caminithermalis]|jgi:L-threonine kinase|uniref:Threonine kinase n=1 Tax=Paramaledivibacter caminithermalis (strain DSM 15212 / CIP 107654 / DViRD3) TaxID=1121301 RepID=A0A1M6MM25_PARC5|nr:hypothetical protein [Paramaledivibacter caminithermalis]SHJ84333.1 threonine kinase [Paramaledivibacter caminithermalis DSM 15212]
MKIKVTCPASCGELIQGLIGDGEKLISLPIDIYSEVTVSQDKRSEIKTNKRKAILALRRTFEYFQIPEEYTKNISLEIKSNIPIAKGMASSTADIAATIMAVTKLLGKKLTPKELGKLCCEIEPTDSVIFQKLTLFDHINGRIVRDYDWNLSMKVLILEPNWIINTEEFRKNDYSNIRQKNQKELEKAYKIFTLACENKDKRLLGKASTISSMANERILQKPKLYEIIDIATKLNAYGVNIAHSGTVTGILYDEKITDIEKLEFILKKRKINNHYTRIYTANMIMGGVRVE